MVLSPLRKKFTKSINEYKTDAVKYNDEINYISKVIAELRNKKIKDKVNW